MYCIVDIETTGGSNKSGRITEIAAFLHDGAKCIDKFVSLVNPGQPIPPFVVNLTGISDAMVAEAPSFDEIADELFRFTANSIFVGHNVNFDYGFLREEFRRVGIEFRRKKLCTVQLSRNTFPGLPSYSLGKIAHELDIDLADAHRAEADARATMQLFERVVARKSLNGLFDANFGSAQLIFSESEWINREVIESIPDECGVFTVLDRDEHTIYVKRSSEMVNTIYDKFRAAETQSDRHFLEAAYRLDFIQTGSPLLAQLIEAHQVLDVRPRFNHDKFSVKAQFGVFRETSDGHTFQLRRYKIGEQPELSFSNFFEGLDYLRLLAESVDLRLVERGRKKMNTSFLAINPITDEKYGLDAILPKDSFAIIDEGIDVDHRSVVYVHSGKVIGYSQLRKDDPVNLFDADTIAERFNPYAELGMIVRQFVIKNKFERKLNWPAPSALDE